jgi:hypothetical protein
MIGMHLIMRDPFDNGDPFDKGNTYDRNAFDNER